MKKLTIILCLAFLCFAAGAVSAKPKPGLAASAAQSPETFTHKQAGVQFDVPNGWKAKPDGEVLTVESPDGSLQVVFWVPDEDSFDAAVKELVKELSKTIKNIKSTGKPTQDTHNGMPFYEDAGTGEVDGAAIAWSVDVVGAKKPLIILTFAAPDLFEKQATGYKKMLASLKKID